MSEDWLGLLINDSLLEEIRHLTQGYERLDYYEMAGKKYGFDICCFRLQDISFRERKASTYVRSHGKWIKRTLPLPAVIHNRAIYFNGLAYRRLSRLANQGVEIFNGWNRYSKFMISRILAENEEFSHYLPATERFSQNQLKKFSNQFTSFLLKPDKGSVGEGIIKAERRDEKLWEFKGRDGHKLKSVSARIGELYPKARRLLGHTRYLLQETIDLATYQGSPFDIRISVQKDGNGEWGITGMVGKAARRGHFLSNVAQGGSVHPLPEIFAQLPHLELSKTVQKLQEVALAMAHYLEKRLPHLADIGFDFGINRTGHPFFIEMNSRDQRYSFAKAGMIDTWKKTYENPVAYARYLLDKRRAKNDEAKHWHPVGRTSIQGNSEEAYRI